MIIPIISRHALKCSTYSVLAVCSLLCLYYIYYVHKIRALDRRYGVGINLGGAFLNSQTYQKYCPLLESSSADIDTNALFQTFDLEASWIHSQQFWDSTFENRYHELIKRKSRHPLKVILVPHSHNDPGWLETYIYYYNTQTAKILNNLIEKLELHKNMTFIWSEVVFLKTWWDTATRAKRQALKQLIRSGRLEITTGGWVMPDEATTHLYALVDQLIEGHQWLYTHLDVQPKYGWSVDAFGHSSTQAQLLALSGIRATVTQRIHYAWKQWLANKQYGDFIWVPNWESKDSKTTILTHNQPFTLYTTSFCGPNEFICSQFDFRVQHEDYPAIIAEDVMKSTIGELLGQYGRTGSLFEHNVVLIPLGCDFCYKDPKDWDLMYENYNKIIKYVKHLNGNNIDIQFGTVKTYFQEVLKRGSAFPTLKGDFFVYADFFGNGLPGYWSGYFTTRPYFKILDRYLEAKLRSTEILYALALYHNNTDNFEQLNIFKRDFLKIINARRTLAAFQHHDSITGTSKSYVMKDNAMKMLEAIYEVTNIQRRNVRTLLFPSDVIVDISDEDMWRDFERTSKQNVFRIDNGSIKKIIFFNPLAQRRTQFVKILTNNVNTKVVVNGTHVPVQISPVWEYFREGTSMFISPRKFELGFFIELPPMSLTIYELHYSNVPVNKPLIYSNTDLSKMQLDFELKRLSNKDMELENPKYVIRFTRSSGLLKYIYNKAHRITSKCVMEIGAYKSVQFLSGAYVFHPETISQIKENDILKPYQPIVHIVIGQLYSQLTVVYGSFFMFSVRLYNSTSYLADTLHIENSVDFGAPENFRDTELYMRLRTNIQNSDPPIIFTDSNGFHMQKRTLVYGAGIAGNYYPITTMAYIEDKRNRLSLITNHAQGVASLKEGNLEVMLDRRIVNDDDKGLGEGVIDNSKIVNEFWLLLEQFEEHSKCVDQISRPSMFANHMSNSLNYPVNMYSAMEVDIHRVVPVVRLLNECFPCDVHVVNLRVQSRFKFPRVFSKNAFLILHRQGYTCNLKSSYMCTFLDFSDSCGFHAVNVTQMVNMSLTGLKNISKPFSSFGQISLPPISVHTYNVTFL